MRTKRHHDKRSPAKKQRRQTLAKRIDAEPDFYKRLDLVIYGRVKTPEADLICAWLALESFADFRTNPANRKGLEDVDPYTGKLRETAEQVYSRWYDETLRKTGKMLAPRLLAGDADFLRRFADEIEAWKEIWRLNQCPQDPARALLLCHENMKTLRPDGRISRHTDSETAKMLAHHERARDVESRVAAHGRNIPRLRARMKLAKRPQGRPRKGDK